MKGDKKKITEDKKATTTEERVVGGYGNIRPEDGKQFSSTYQPAEKWTEPVAKQLIEDLITWMKEEDLNIFYEEYIVMERGLYPTITSYLGKKFSSVSKLLGMAKKIQEIKLKKFGIQGALNPQLTKFVLNVEHGMIEKKETGITIDTSSKPDLSKISTETLEELKDSYDGDSDS